MGHLTRTRVELAHDAAARWISENARDVLDILDRAAVDDDDVEAGQIAADLREIMAEWRAATMEFKVDNPSVGAVPRSPT